jgi:DNA topoisomerase-1
LQHQGKYARLTSTAEVFETGMNAAVAKLADAANGGARGRGAAREPLAVLGAHPESAKELKVMEGRFGPYVTDGTTHATLPKSADPAAVTLDEAVALIDAKAAKAPVKGKKKAPAKKKAAPKKK